MTDFGKWRDPAFVPDLKVVMVDPHDLDRTRGTLEGVTKVSLTEGYYSDTRISGSITTIDDNYAYGSWLRVIVDGKEVGTFGVSHIDASQDGEKTYELQSVLWMLSGDIAYELYTIGKGCKLATAVTQVCKRAGMTAVFSKGYINKKYTSSKLYEQTDSRLSILNDICNSAGNQLGVDGHGRVTVQRYVTPSQRTVSWVLDPDDPRGIILDPGYEETDETGDASNRTVVIADAQSGKKRICQYVDPPTSSPVSFNKRGWRKTAVHVVTELSPWTAARAKAMARQYLADDSSRGITRDISTMYFPCKSGQIVTWGKSSKKYMIQTVDSDLEEWTCKITLKEV